MFLKNISISRLLLLIYAALLVVLFAVQLIDYQKLSEVRHITGELLDKSLSRQSLLTKMRRGSDYTHVNVLRLLLYKDTKSKEEAEKKVYAEIKKNDSNIAQYAQLIADRQEQQLFDNLNAYRSTHAKNRAAVLQLIKEGRHDEALNLNASSLVKSFEDFQLSNTTLSQYVSKRDTANIQKSENQFDAIERTNMGLNALIFLVLALLGLMIFRTIKKLKINNWQLAESERKYRLLVEHTNEIINQCDNRGNLLFVNDYCRKKLEYSEEEVSHLTVMDILSEESKHLYKPNPRKSECGDIIIGMRKTLKSKTGNKIITEGNVLLEYKDQIFSGAMGFFKDVTEKVHLEELLVSSEKKYRQLFNLSPVPMWVVDPATFKFVQVNKAAIHKYGYSQEEFLAMTIMDISSKADIANIKHIVNNPNQLSGVFKNDFRHIKKSGEKIDVETYSLPVMLNEKEQIITIATDVTARNLYERKITSTIIKTQEEERYQIGSELHDNICQILATTQITLGMMKKSLLPDGKELFDKTDQYILLASNEIRNLSHRLAPVFFDDTTLENAFEKLFTSLNIEKKYEIVLHFDEPSKRYPLNHDLQINVYRILQEQLNNILKHANATRIETEVVIKDNLLKMRIADNGVGFNPDEHTTGIGFANMKRRAELFSGTFSSQSGIGKGCEIIVEIPLSNTN